MFLDRFSVTALVLVASLSAACQSGAPAGSARSGGASGSGSGGGGAGSGGAPGGGGGAPLVDAGAGGGTGGAAAVTCDQSPTPLRAAGTTVEVPLDLVYQGKPFVYGEPNAVTSTLTVLPLNVRFYLSAVELLTAGGGSVPVDMITATGEVQPYGVFLFNAEDPAMQTLRVRAPAGSYTGIKVALGLNVPCDVGDPGGRTFPLSEDSQMTWPKIGHLFLRYEALNSVSGTDPDGGAAPIVPSAIHMGGDLLNRTTSSAVVFRIAGALSVPASGGPASKRLRVAMDQIWKGASADIDVSNSPLTGEPEVAAGERLRRTAADLPLFVLGD